MRQLCLIALLSSPLIVSCGGGSSSAPPTSSVGTSGTTAQFEGGIWQGNLSENGTTDQILALASPSGQFYSEDINQSNGCAAISTGNVSVSASSITGSVLSALAKYSTSPGIQTDCVYADGSTWSSGTITGTIDTGSNLTLTTKLTTADGTSLPSESGSLAFEALYNEGSSLSKISGNWTGPTGVVTSISSDGSSFAQDPTTSCVVNGQYSIINTRYNVYSLSATYADCTGVASVLNGLSATGLVTLNDTVTPTELEGGGTVKLANGAVVVVLAASTRSGQGAPTSFTLGGTISGLSSDGLTLEDNGGNPLSIASGTAAFTFPGSALSGTTYAVAIQTQPNGETCVVSNGTGTIQSRNVVNVTVSCTSNTISTYTIGGSISGLSQSGLVLTDNGGNALAVNAGATSFSFASGLVSGSGYSVAVHMQPTGETCIVSSGSGTVSGNVTNVAVNCTVNTFTVGGTISGLTESGLVLQDDGSSVDQIASGATSFALPSLPTGSAYSVTVEAQPSTESCSVSNGTGTMGTANVTNVAVSCVEIYSIGGTVSGLSGGTDIVLQVNGGANLSISANGQFTFGTGLPSGQPYSITVLTQPTGETCSVSNGVGTIADAPITNAAVTCATSGSSAPVSYSPFEGVWASGTDWFVIDGSGNYFATQPFSDCGDSPFSGILASDGTSLQLIWDVGGGLCRDTPITVTFSVSGQLTSLLAYTYHEDGLAPGTPATFATTSTVQWTRSAVSNAPPSLASLAGNYLLADAHTVVSIDSNGNLTTSAYAASVVDSDGTFTSLPCPITGTVTISDPARNVYTLTVTNQAICDGDFSEVPSGTQGAGAITLDGNKLHGGFAIQGGGAHISVSMEGTRS